MTRYDESRTRVLDALLAEGYDGSGSNAGLELQRHGENQILVGRAFRRGPIERDLLGIVNAYANALQRRVKRLRYKALEVHEGCDASPRTHVHLTF